MKKLDHKSDLRERKALVLARFSLVAAQAMCGHDVPFFSAPELSDPCPSCGACQPGDLRWLVPAPLAGRYRSVDAPCEAVRLSCGRCRFNGDAVAYVMANYNINRVDFALSRIEDYLDGIGAGIVALEPKRRRQTRPALPKMAFKDTPRRKRKRIMKGGKS